MKKNLDALPQNGIRSKPRREVKVGALLAIALLLGCAALSFHARAGDSNFSIVDTDTIPPPEKDGEIPNIQARAYDVIPVKQSASLHCYLFSDPDGAKPHVGRIILLKKGNESVMAFRVLQVLFDEREFIGKRVRRYHDENKLDLQQKYTAIERLSETGMPDDLRYSDQDQADVNELSPKPEATPVPEALAPGPPATVPADFFRSDEIAPSTGPTTDPNPPKPGELDDEAKATEPVPPKAGELDDDASAAQTPPVAPLAGELDDDSPSKTAQAKKAKASDDDEEDDSQDVAINERDEVKQIEDVDELDINHNAITAEFGFLSALDNSMNSTYYTGAGIRYGLTLGSMLMLNRASLQDSLTLEGAAFLYKVVGYADPNGLDSYTVLPLIGTLRYTVLTGDTLGFFLYGGMEANRVIKSSGPVTDQALANLSTGKAALGGGLLYRFGPGWEARADIGTEMIAFGLMLRF